MEDKEIQTDYIATYEIIKESDERLAEQYQAMFADMLRFKESLQQIYRMQIHQTQDMWGLINTIFDRSRDERGLPPAPFCSYPIIKTKE